MLLSFKASCSIGVLVRFITLGTARIVSLIEYPSTEKSLQNQPFRTAPFVADNMVHAELGKNFLFLDTETQAQKMLQFSASIIHKR